MAKLILTCSWCNEANDKLKQAIKVFCWSCGHRADVPRVECDCRQCRAREANVQHRKAAQFREAS
jgi:hypothetical protein